MARLDKSINDIDRIILKRVQESSLANGKKIREWKGRKLLNAEKWHKMVKSSDDLMDVLDYIPDSYMERPLRYFRNKVEPEALVKKWVVEYYEYLEFAKDKKYGRHICAECILNPNFAIKPSCFRDFMVDDLKKEKVQFPCLVLNIFECPYDKWKNTLLFGGDVWKIFHEALRHACLITSEVDDIYHIDYEKKLVGPHHEEVYYPIKERLGVIKLPSIPVRRKEDVYEILGNKKTLGTLFDQYIESVKNGTLRVSKNQIGKSDYDLEGLRKNKDEIVDFVIQVKDSVNIQKMDSLYAEGFLENSARPDKPENCFICRLEAKIHCINCDRWVCISHWREHGIKSHNYTD